MILYYVHDPMCSWCWAYRPVLEQLRTRLPTDLTLKNLLGGLAPDSDKPMPDEIKAMVKGHWKHIQDTLGTPFNFRFWTECNPRRSTYISCRATLAAAEQSKEEEMILAIQEAYYLRAMNPSNEDTLIQLAGELEMDTVAFRNSLNSDRIEQEFQTQMAQARAWPVSGFPSFILEAGSSVVPIPLDYRSAEVTVNALIEQLSNY
jgi:putative protein-disulfide isomerase